MNDEYIYFIIYSEDLFQFLRYYSQKSLKNEYFCKILIENNKNGKCSGHRWPSKCWKINVIQ